MTEKLDLDPIEAREKAASEHISELCHGRLRWTMRIPADPEHDSDLVISRSLTDVPALVAEVRSLRDQAADLDGRLARLLDTLDNHEWRPDLHQCSCQTWHDHGPRIDTWPDYLAHIKTTAGLEG